MVFRILLQNLAQLGGETPAHVVVVSPSMRKRYWLITNLLNSIFLSTLLGGKHCRYFGKGLS